VCLTDRLGQLVVVFHLAVTSCISFLSKFNVFGFCTKCGKGVVV